LKTITTSQYSTIDFYMATLDEKTGDVHDTWENVTWSKCYDESNTLVKKQWNGVTLNLPQNYETKLIKRYGFNWKTPSNFNGNRHINML